MFVYAGYVSAVPFMYRVEPTNRIAESPACAIVFPSRFVRQQWFDRKIPFPPAVSVSVSVSVSAVSVSAVGYTE